MKESRILYIFILVVVVIALGLILGAMIEIKTIDNSYWQTATFGAEQFRIQLTEIAK